MTELLDIQHGRVVPIHDQSPARSLACDVLIVGGGLGGVAAALAACDRGRTVVLTDETDWLGGQLTTQGVCAPDEHQYIEQFGGTRRYYALRRGIRNHYRDSAALSPEALAQEHLNPGGGWVSRLCCEPRVALAVLESMLQPHVEAGRLTLRRRHKAHAAVAEGDRVRSVTLAHLDSGDRLRVEASFFIDATELGDLLPLTGTEYVTGAEAREQTGEPHARPDEPAPECVQSFTYPFALELDPGGGETIPRPEGYADNRLRQPYTFAHVYYDGRGAPTYRMFERGEGGVPPFWTYRRLVAAENFADPRYPRDVAVINWPGNDFRDGNLIDNTAAAQLRALHRAKNLSLGLCYWLQTEAPRDDGGSGYRELRLRPDVMGTADGLSKYPYIRESRRIQARRTIREQEIAAAYQQAQEGSQRAAFMLDSVGVGLYPIDIHPGQYEEKIVPQPARPFQIPLGALLPCRVMNLLPGCKNIGTTHITNGAYRLHPVEWNIGESAGALAAFCLDRAVAPASVGTDPAQLRDFQARLVEEGIPLDWHVDVPLGHPAFAAVQLLSAWGLWPADRHSLEFRPGSSIDPWAKHGPVRGDGKEEAARFLREKDPPSVARAVSLLPDHPTRADLAIAWLAALRAV